MPAQIEPCGSGDKQRKKRSRNAHGHPAPLRNAARMEGFFFLIYTGIDSLLYSRYGIVGNIIPAKTIVTGII